MNRRAFLRQSSLACAALSPLAFPPLWAQGAGLLHARTHPGIRTSRMPLNLAACGLPRVRVERNNVLRTVVGLRPYRPSGFVVRAEKLDDTLVIHNYGHGGAGLSLSWGTAQLAMQLGCEGYAAPVAVLGCGAVGLATARLLQESGYKVTIYAKALPPDTTSNIAGGAWTPFLVADPGRCNAGFEEQMRSATELSYKRFLAMLGDRYGVRWVASYAISQEGLGGSSRVGERSALGALAPGFQDLTREEHPFPADVVRQSETLLIEPPRYLQALLDEFREASGEVVVRNIADRTAITQLPENVVFNCTDLGAKDIFQDDQLTPVRGQLTILRPQPEVKYAVSHDELYMLPRTDGIVLGGTYELGVSSLAPDRDKMHKILTRHKAFFDSYRCAV